MSDVSNEQRAHDLAILLCSQTLPKEYIPCSDNGKLWEFVKTYEHYYSYVLSRFEEKF